MRVRWANGAMGLVRGGVLAVLGVAMVAGSAESQRFEWPERAENLTVLPEDFPANRLRAVMTGFSRTLGVRCEHCHVGAPGASLAEMDFPSDENPNKQTARIMLEMLGSINDYLDTVEPTGPERVNMWCGTCHNGKPRPMTLGESLDEAFAEGGTEAAMEAFASLRERYYARGAYDFSADGVARVVGQWVRGEELGAAMALARRNLTDYPDAAVTHQSLGDVFLEMGDADNAITHYEHALARDPENRQVRRSLEQLKGGGQG